MTPTALVKFIRSYFRFVLSRTVRLSSPVVWHCASRIGAFLDDELRRDDRSEDPAFAVDLDLFGGLDVSAEFPLMTTWLTLSSASTLPFRR